MATDNDSCPLMKERTRKLRRLNDYLRQTRKGGKYVLSGELGDLDENIQFSIFVRIAYYSHLNGENDAQNEHNSGWVNLGDGEKIIWKIDYFDLNMKNASPDPSDSNVTRRVLTAMLSIER